MAAFSSLFGMTGATATRSKGAIGAAGKQGAAAAAAAANTQSTVGTPNPPATPNPYPFAIEAVRRQRTRTTLAQKTRTRQAAGTPLTTGNKVTQKPGLTALSGGGFGRSLFTGSGLY
jgi:hypothetical protein